jgi:ribokinase
VVITLGEDGAILVTAKEEHRIPIYEVENVVDTTGAGDSFNSAFVSCIYKGMKPLEAADFASAVAALSVTKVGAQSMPRWKEVEEFIASKPKRGPVR